MAPIAPALAPITPAPAPIAAAPRALIGSALRASALRAS